MSTTAQKSEKKTLSTWSATLLVAEREIVTQVRAKSFLLSLAVTALLLVGGIVLIGVFGSSDDDAPEVALVEVTGEPAEQIEAAGLATQSADSMDEAEQLLRDGEVEAIITSDEFSPAGVLVIGLDEPPSDVIELLSISPPVELLDEESSDDWWLRYFVALGFGMVFMMVVMGSTMIILQNTIQEKQNRIVEILISAIPARALLGGKVLGNSALGIGQALVFAAASVLGLMVTGQQEILDMLTVPLLWFALFLIPGFVLFASMFAAGASLVSRQEDAGPITTPLIFIVMSPLFAAIFLHQSELGLLITSYIPFTAPVSMPLRMFFNEAMWFEPLVALAILVVTTLGVIALAAKIYSNSLLKTGQRVALKSALSSKD